MLIFFSIKWVKFRLLWHSTNKNVLYFRLTIISCKNETTQDVEHVHKSALFKSAQTRGRKIQSFWTWTGEKGKEDKCIFPSSTLDGFGFWAPLHHRHCFGRFVIRTFPRSSTEQRNVTTLLLGSVIYATPSVPNYRSFWQIKIHIFCHVSRHSVYIDA